MRELPSLWRRAGRKILASNSATRLALLNGAALPIEAQPAGIDERAFEAAHLARGGDVRDLAASLALEKALAVSRLCPDALVIGADQTLTLGAEVFHKAPTRAAAAANLRRLAGRSHRLTSAVAVAERGKARFELQDVAELTMRVLDSKAIHCYLEAAGEGALTSVGAYQIEGVGVHLFSRVAGAHSTILGLPLLPLLAWLRDQELIGP